MRRWLAPALAVIGLVTSATPALGLLLWTLTATPLSAPSGVPTTFHLTATNLDLLTELGCLEVDLPASFGIVDASAGAASNGDAWEAVVFPNKVAVHSLSGGGRLELGQSVTFEITAIPTQPGTWTWANHAHRQQDCSGIDEIGAPLTFLVVPGPTPSPTPTPAPILSLEPLPTLPPIDPLPTILPTPQPLPTVRLPTPAPTLPSPSSPVSSPTLSPSPTPSPGPANDVGAPGGTSGPPGASGAGAVLLELADPGASGGSVGDVSLGPLGVVDGVSVWAIPGAVVGGPGLLVILWVMLQTGVAVAWIPTVRRMRGKDGARPGASSGPRRTVAP